MFFFFRFTSQKNIWEAKRISKLCWPTTIRTTASFTEAADGHDVDSAPNGVQLMKMLHHVDTLPDFVFIDLNMPEKNGKECLQEIRQHDRLKDIPVIIYSTSSSKKDIEDTFDLGANLYITKPNSYSELKKTVQNILQIDWSKYRPKTHRDVFVYSPE